MLKPLSRAIASIVATALLAAFSVGNQQYYPFKSAVIDGPYYHPPFSAPFIQHATGSRREMPEHPRTPLKPGIPNNLPVGGVLPFPAGRATKAKIFGIGFTIGSPPDPDLAAGPNHVIVSVNTSFAIFAKDGTKLVEQTFDSFFASVKKDPFLSDPIVFYDRAADRWLMSIDCIGFNSKVNQQLIGVSKTGDPMGAWNLYGIDSIITSNNVQFWMDYPKYGFNKDAVVIAGNMFDFPGVSALGAALIVLNKAALYSGGSVTAKFFSLPSLPTVEPSRIYDAVEPNIYASSVQTGSSMTILSITNPASNPVVNQTSITIPDMEAPQSDAVAPFGHFLDGFVGDGRLYNCKWRTGHLVTAHNINNRLDGAIACRWYDIATNSYPLGQPTLVQTGTIPGPGGTDMFQPAVTINSRGTIGLVFSNSGANLAPQLMFAAHRASDKLGFVSKPVSWQSSLGSTYGDPGFNRWGDYFGIDVDPNDDKTFWIFGEVGDSSNHWNTYLTSFFVDTFQQQAPAQSIAMFEGSSFSGTVQSTFSIDPAYFTVASKLFGSQGQIASAIATFVPGNPAGSLQFGHLDTVINGPVGASAFIFLYNWKTLKYDLLQTQGMNNSDQALSIQLTVGQIAAYTNPTTGVIKAAVRGVWAPHLTTPAKPFMLRINYLQFVQEVI